MNIILLPVNRIETFSAGRDTHVTGEIDFRPMLLGIFKKTPAFVAEIGMNHNGDPELAGRMIDAAAAAGAHGVKFQTFVPELMNTVYTKSLLEKGIEGEPDGEAIDFLSKYVLSEEVYRGLKARADEKNVVFFSSPFDIPSVELLERIGVPLYKIASSELTNDMLLEAVGTTKKPVIMSTGISSEEEIDRAISILRSRGTPELLLLHCVSLYPVSAGDVNLSAIPALQRRFGLKVGFSDHSRDIRAADLAAALGCVLFERHFTLDRSIDCPDRSVSLDPRGLMTMIESIEEVILMMGSGNISSGDPERDVALSARRSLCAARDIPAGSVISAGDLAAKRPGVGIPVYRRNTLIGRKARVAISRDFIIREEHLE